MNHQLKLALIFNFFAFLTLFTLVPPALLLIFGHSKAWVIYTYTYFTIILVYTWYVFIFLAYQDIKQKKVEKNLEANFTVIIPSYNENPDLLEKCITSVCQANGNKQVIFIDDGSNNREETWKVIDKLKLKYSYIKAFRFDKNLGKRHGLYFAFKMIETEFFITIDSDTVLDKDAFVYLLSPFDNPKVGAASGNIKLINENNNLLTRITAGLYLSGLSIYKKSQSVLGNVLCCSGCLSAYRTEIVKNVADEFLNQTFLNKRATHSEDRHLTNLVLEKGYKVKFVEEALCYTETPENLKGFIKQQMRWKRGFITESTYLLTFSWSKSKTLFFESTVGSVIPFYLNIGAQLLIIAWLFINPFIVLYLLPIWIISLTIRELPMFLQNPRIAIWFYLYIPIYNLIILPSNVWAIITVNNKKWLTREIKINKTIPSENNIIIEDDILDQVPLPPIEIKA